MNLHPVAQAVKSQGRGPDTMLVHMSPNEVHGLQALAMRHGGSLTINPETGLPEAGFLDKLLPVILGAGITVATGGAAAPWMIGAGIGGIEAIRTGDLGKGLMAGLGAYGGAGLAGGLMNTGIGALSPSAGASVADTGMGGAGALANGAGTAAQTGADLAANATPWDKMSAGFNQATSSGANALQFAKDNKWALGAAAAPIFAAENVQQNMPKTTTPMIRRFTYDPYGQTYSPAGSYAANQPVNAARGGLMGLAKGGIAGFAAGDAVTLPIDRASQIDTAAQAWFTDNPTATFNDALSAGQGAGLTQAEIDGVYQKYGGVSGLTNWINANANAGIDDTAIAQAMQQFKVSPEQVAQVSGVDLAEVQRRYETALAPLIVKPFSMGVADYQGITRQLGSGTGGIYDNLMNAGITAQELAQYLGHDPSFASGYQRGYDVAGTIKGWYDYENGLPDADWVDMMDENNYSAGDIAVATGLSEIEVQNRYDAVVAARKKAAEDAARNSSVYTGNTQGAGTQGGVRDITNVAGGTLPPGAGGSSGAGQIGGGTVVNPNGTITTSPRIPGIPVGGFTGMQSLRDAYTTGGGRLGIAGLEPMTPAQLAAKYQTSGDSKNAYDYLSGKSSYPLLTSAPEIYKPYSEAMGVPQDMSTRKYIFDQATSTFKENPAYREPIYESNGNRILKPPVRDIEAAYAAAETGTAGTGDAAIQAMLDARQLTIAEVAERLGISLADAKTRFKVTAVDATGKVVNESDSGNDGAGFGGTSTSDADVSGANNEDSHSADGNDPGGDDDSDRRAGGLIGLAKGGLSSGSFVVPADVLSAAGNGSTKAGLAAVNNQLRGYKAGGATLISGEGDGLSDSIPTSIDGRRPAAVADGEAYIDPRTVARLGGGDAKKGAAKLYSMMDRIRTQAHGKKAQQRPVNVAKAFA